jgi:hypothetical protein
VRSCARVGCEHKTEAAACRDGLMQRSEAFDADLLFSKPSQTSRRGNQNRIEGI